MTEVENLSEKAVQKLIADYPWLLNIDYELVPELKDKGMEYVLSYNKRADLVLRDRISGRPVIVEFKAVPFYRENIGQILEYKARVISESTRENSILKDVFGDGILAPITVLVVPSSDAESRLACNLSGIDIYEYEKTVPQILVPEKKVALEEIKKNFNGKGIPIDESRNERVSRVYNDIRSVLNEENSPDGWTSYRNPSGEYLMSLNQIFVNKWIFPNNKVSIGIYEDIFNDSNLDKVIVEYFSDDKEVLMQFINKYRELNMFPENNSDDINNDDYDGYFWSFYVDKKVLFDMTKETIKPFIKNYNSIIRTM